MQVLDLLWNLAHRDDCPTDTMDHALNAHIKILDYSCSQVCLHHSNGGVSAVVLVGEREPEATLATTLC